jgi:transglutaminase superfamily protein
MLLYVRAFWQLLRFQFYVLRGNFELLQQKVSDYPCSARASPRELIERICLAADVLCICYPWQVLCLQRSSATTCLLRRYGVMAQMVIGVQKFPFKMHAWVEVDNCVVNDKPYTREMYTVLDCSRTEATTTEGV